MSEAIPLVILPTVANDSTLLGHRLYPIESKLDQPCDRPKKKKDRKKSNRVQGMTLSWEKSLQYFFSSRTSEDRQLRDDSGLRVVITDKIKLRAG